MQTNTVQANISIESQLNAEAYEGDSALREYDNFVELFPVEERLMGEFLDPKHEVLDLGCGAGRTTFNLVKAGFDVVAVDLSEKLVKAAKIRCPQAVVRQADVRELPFENGRFHQAWFSFNGMDHVHPRYDYLKALKEVNRVLKPGGIFLYSGHNVLGRFGRHIRSPREFLSAMIWLHPKYLWLQLRGSEIHRWYWRYLEPFGEVIAFSAPPFVHRKLHAVTGFETAAVRGGRSGASERRLTWMEHHVHYVLRKKAP